MKKLIKYRKGYKYQLAEDYYQFMPFAPDKDIDTEYISFGLDKLLRIKEGYAWDGPSGPTIDTESSMRGALVHDALYQLLRMQKLPQSMRPFCDEIAVVPLL